MTEANDNGDTKTASYLKKLKNELLNESRPVEDRPKRRSSRRSDAISVRGNGNTVINGNNVIHIHPPTPKKIVIVKSGDGTISSAQQAELKALVDEIVALEAQLKRRPRGYAAVWASLNKRMKVTRYVEIPSEKFMAARASLEKERALLLGMNSAHRKVSDWRKKRYAAINARAKEFPGGEMRFRKYAEERFGSGSLKDLDDDQLEAVYRYVFSW